MNRLRLRIGLITGLLVVSRSGCSQIFHSSLADTFPPPTITITHTRAYWGVWVDTADVTAFARKRDGIRRAARAAGGTETPGPGARSDGFERIISYSFCVPTDSLLVLKNRLQAVDTAIASFRIYPVDLPAGKSIERNEYDSLQGPLCPSAAYVVIDLIRPQVHPKLTRWERVVGAADILKYFVGAVLWVLFTVAVRIGSSIGRVVFGDSIHGGGLGLLITLVILLLEAGFFFIVFRGLYHVLLKKSRFGPRK